MNKIATKIYVIGKCNRLRELESYTGLLRGIDNPIFVDGRAESASVFFESQRRYFKLSGRLLSPGEYGCSQAHLQALDIIADSNEGAVVFEDDVIIPSSFRVAYLKGLCSNLKSTEVVILGCQEGLPTASKLEDGFVYRVRAGGKIYRTAAYLIGSNAARHIAALQRRYSARADDWALFSERGACDLLYFNLCEHPAAPDPLMEYERRGNDPIRSASFWGGLTSILRKRKIQASSMLQRNPYVRLAAIEAYLKRGV